MKAYFKIYALAILFLISGCMEDNQRIESDLCFVLDGEANEEQLVSDFDSLSKKYLMKKDSTHPMYKLYADKKLNYW